MSAILSQRPKITPNEIFLFVNPKSGGQTGEEIMEVRQPLQVQVPSGDLVSLRIFSLLDGSPGNKPGFHALRETSNIVSTRAIVAGGDGTVKWALAEAIKHGIEVERRVVFGIMPLGTGNDFSRAMGWGGSLPTSLMLRGWEKTLEGMVRTWWTAPSRGLDVWKVSLKVDDRIGHIDQINKDREPEALDSSTFSTSMINYFSVGLDGKMGFGFDKHRTSSRLCNFGVYILEAAKKTFKATCGCNSNARIADYIAGAYNGKNSSGECIFDTFDDSYSALRPRLVTDKPRLLVVFNIASYGGGSAHFWESASRLGVDVPLDPHLMRAHADPGDGKLEVVTLRDLPMVALDPVAHYASFMGPKRVFSGAPLHIEFKEHIEEDSVAYCQIDGEFFRLVNAASTTVTHERRVQVLYDPNNVDENELHSDGSADDTGSERGWLR